jgi:hypothetical protein
MSETFEPMRDHMSTTKYVKRTRDNPWAEWVSEDVTDEVAALRAERDELRAALTNEGAPE